jgi:RimJ/RimL family protein N-acetyltransferase
MKDTLETNRLVLDPLTPEEAPFILELVNTPEWIQFIGDRNVNNIEEAQNYIQKILDNTNVNYWIVKLKNEVVPVGVITFIKRDYLEHSDIGFAFLPHFSKNGYAIEATKAALDEIIKSSKHSHILATTVKENRNSIQLLEKLGLEFDKEIAVDKDELLLYTIAVDKLLIDDLTKQFFNIFNNTNKQQPNWELIHSVCIPETVIIKKIDLKEEVYNLETFIAPRKKILSDGTLTEFEEKEINEETKILGNIAQRFTKYQKSGFLNGVSFKEYGNKFFQFIKTTQGWRINSVIWEDE